MKRSDLPRLAYTVNPATGTPHLLVNGVDILNFATVRFAPSEDTDSVKTLEVLEIRVPILDPVVTFVPWSTLGDIAAAEAAEREVAQ